MGIRAEQKEKRRQDIFDTALHLFIHKGYAGTSIRDISRVLSISPGLLFHYFATKEDMLAAMIEMAMRGVSSATSLLEGPSLPLDKFENIARMIFGSFADYPQSAPLFLLMHQVTIMDSIPPRVKEMISANHTIEYSVKIIQEGQRIGNIREGDPFALSLAFWGAIQGIAETIAMYPQSPVPEAGWIVKIIGE